mmetsp:Transcript_30482/g.70291  ORF Transcript_30482/g.70291 Transcript_30482/m.70291 type:complete len:241 (+) Transcript_30482:448-1170(+)
MFTHLLHDGNVFVGLRTLDGRVTEHTSYDVQNCKNRDNDIQNHQADGQRRNVEQGLQGFCPAKSTRDGQKERQHTFGHRLPMPGQVLRAMWNRVNIPRAADGFFAAMVIHKLGENDSEAVEQQQQQDQRPEKRTHCADDGKNERPQSAHVSKKADHTNAAQGSHEPHGTHNAKVTRRGTRLAGDHEVHEFDQSLKDRRENHHKVQVVPEGILSTEEPSASKGHNLQDELHQKYADNDVVD